MTPGNCPPSGIDDTYPWCSAYNESYCPDGGLAGYANGIVMAGYTSPGVFVSYVENGAFWKDAVSANHGE